MPSAEKRINLRYSKLLSETFEKYKDIDVISKRSSSKEDKKENTVKGKTVLTKKTIIELKTKSETKCTSKPFEGPKKTKKASNQPRQVKGDFYLKKKFTPDEDKMILTTFEDQGNCSDTIKHLCETMSRTSQSIKGRHEILLNEKRDPKRSFTIQEDMLIIEDAVESLKQGISLRDVKISNSGRDLEKSLVGRGYRSIFDRWKKMLQPWLLQYYNKNLNLEIRPMLANIIADHFESISSVDWGFISSFPEFSGYTEQSLRSLYGNQVITLVEGIVGKSRKEMSLKEIASVAEARIKNIKVRKSVFKRQNEVIKYFENCLKKNNIEIEM